MQDKNIVNISVCIPVYNCNVENLVNALLKELQRYAIEYEVVLIDDASHDNFKRVNSKLANLKNVTYIELHENVGRSSIRNMFLKHVNFENLLFLDSDSLIRHKFFIGNYLSAMQKNYSVICGGRRYGAKPKKRKYLLRWAYGIDRECKHSEKRNQKPYQSFMSNNFLVKKTILQNIRFDERLTNYGHEDSLFAYQLMTNKIDLLHIYNPTEHDYNETAGEFLEKTKQAIDNLILINKQIVPNNEFANFNKLLNTYFKLKNKGFLPFFKFLAFIFNPVLSFLLRNGIVNLTIFDIYKLLYLTKKY